MTAPDILFAPADHRHVAFVLETWMKSMRFSHEFVDMTDDDYYTWAREHIAGYLGESECLAALDPLDSDGIIGYVVYDGPVLHWAYIRKDLRNQGVFKELKLQANPSGFVSYSHAGAHWDAKRSGLVARPWFCRQYDLHASYGGTEP